MGGAAGNRQRDFRVAAGLARSGQADAGNHPSAGDQIHAPAFEKRFGSQPMKLFCVLVIFVFLLPYSASVYKGLDQRLRGAVEGG